MTGDREVDDKLQQMVCVQHTICVATDGHMYVHQLVLRTDTLFTPASSETGVVRLLLTPTGMDEMLSTLIEYHRAIQHMCSLVRQTTMKPHAVCVIYVLRKTSSLGLETNLGGIQLEFTEPSDRFKQMTNV